jgi:hypothetical protein
VKLEEKLLIILPRSLVHGTKDIMSLGQRISIFPGQRRRYSKDKK